MKKNKVFLNKRRIINCNVEYSNINYKNGE